MLQPSARNHPAGEGGKADLSEARITQDGTALMVLPKTDYDFYRMSP